MKPRDLGRGLVLAFAAAFTVAAVGAGCSVVVNKAASSYPCQPGVANACPTGEYCKGNACAACEATDECDGLDNDCNGVVDNGPNAPCGDGGVCQNGTCFVGLGSSCTTDEQCTAPLRCNTETGSCAAPTVCNTTTCPPPKQCVGGFCRSAVNCTPACTTGQVCDPDTNKCVSPTGSLGAPCSGSKSCASGICGDTAVFGTTIAQRLEGAVCTKPCCTSADCGAGFVCGSTTVGRLCIPVQGLYDTPLGTGKLGTSCTKNEECAAGLCLGGRCSDLCCKEAACAEPSSPVPLACRLSEGVRGRYDFACRALPTSATGAYGSTCDTPADCQTNACLYPGRCTRPCCGISSCDGTTCSGTSTATGQGGVNVCQITTATGKANGETCRQNSECKSFRCYSFPDGVSRCSDVCCGDADCGNPDLVCRLFEATPGELFLRCVPKT